MKALFVILICLFSTACSSMPKIAWECDYKMLSLKQGDTFMDMDTTEIHHVSGCVYRDGVPHYVVSWPTLFDKGLIVSGRRAARVDI